MAMDKMDKKFCRQQQNNSFFPKVRITLRLKKTDGATSTYRTSKTKRIYSFLKAENFLEAFLLVNYQKPFSNFGVYETKEDLIFAIKAFTEKGLVNYLKGGVSDE